MMAGMGEMMMGGDYDGGDGVGEMGGEGDADEMVCRLGEGINLSGGFGTPATLDAEGDNADDGGATQKERAAMLGRLDGMLVVPAEYEIAGDDEEGAKNEHAGGQFDDAEESGDDLL